MIGKLTRFADVYKTEFTTAIAVLDAIFFSWISKEKTWEGRTRDVRTRRRDRKKWMDSLPVSRHLSCRLSVGGSPTTRYLTTRSRSFYQLSLLLYGIEISFILSTIIPCHSLFSSSSIDSLCSHLLKRAIVPIPIQISRLHFA